MYKWKLRSMEVRAARTLFRLVQKSFAADSNADLVQTRVAESPLSSNVKPESSHILCFRYNQAWNGASGTMLQVQSSVE